MYPFQKYPFPRSITSFYRSVTLAAMATHKSSHNLYLAYKRDTNLLLYWIIQKFNDLIKSLPDGDKPSFQPNSTGQTTVAGLLSMSKFIASNSTSDTTVPTAIYRLFRSVIDKRSAVWETYQSLANTQSDPEFEESNSGHKAFIDALQEAFEALGGDQWAACPSASQKAADHTDEDEIKQALFTNRFSSLGIDGDLQDSGQSDDDVPRKTLHAPAHQKQRSKPRKGKKGKKKVGKKYPKTTHIQQADLEDVPLESYRIIESDFGIMTEYLMAAYGLADEWADLRDYLQNSWLDVAYNGLNSAVAGTLSNIAIAMLKRSELAIFAQFPGHDSYETVMRTITHGGPDNPKTSFSLHRWVVGPGIKPIKEGENLIDVREMFLVHVYDDFMTFLNDFRHNRNGKPTKSMAASIDNWDPNLDLQHATNEQRLKWRRAYIINWLYDLVNVYSSPIVQENTLKGQNWDLSKVDWSPRGPASKYTVLFGLNDFAGFVCSLAWQKQGVDVGRKILPHHILQLQCIVDSMTISRGWSLSPMKGHILRKPASDFRPLRDLDLFLDRKNDRPFSGFMRAAGIYGAEMEQSTDPMHPKLTSQLVRTVLDSFGVSLGETTYVLGLDTIPPSRFSSTNANGLWEYSPFLCGVGLMEGLDISYCLGMAIWDCLPEPILAVHLHNMLVQKGYIQKPVELYQGIGSSHSDCFFTGGQKPTSDFADALMSRVGEVRSILRKKLKARQMVKPDLVGDPRKIFNVEHNGGFTKKSNLILYRQAEGIIESIPESDITLFSTLARMRLSQVGQYTDEKGQRRLEETELVRRYLNLGSVERPFTMTDLVKSVDDWCEMVTSWKDEEKAALQKHQDVALHAMQRECTVFSSNDLRAGLNSPAGSNSLDMFWHGSRLLDALKLDIYGDVCGHDPDSSLNYLWVTVRFLWLFETIEKELKTVNNVVYRRAFEIDRKWERRKRLGLVYLAMETQDKECLEIMARAFQNPRAGFQDHIFWDTLDVKCEFPNQKVKRSPVESGCVVM